MRKTLIMSMLLVVIMGVFGIGMAAAQDKIAIEPGQYVEGELTNSAYEVKYTFEGKAGQLVMVEMLPKPGTYDLDPAVILRDSDGDILGQNDDWAYPLSLVVVELSSDEEYTILATRNGGSTGSSEGAYWIRLTFVEALTSGSKVEATLTSDSEKETPNLYVVRPTESGPVTFTLSQEPGDLYAALELAKWEDDSYGGTTAFELSDSATLTKASFTVNLEADTIYVLNVSRSFSAYSFDPVEATVTVGID